MPPKKQPVVSDHGRGLAAVNSTSRAVCSTFTPMTDLMRFAGAVQRSADVEAWFSDPDHVLRQMARPWFMRMRDCGADVRELLHDFCPTACVEDAAFAYVNAFTGHVNVGFFQGASLADPAGLLEGSGKRMRHVKLRWGQPVDETALTALIVAAHADMRARVDAEASA